MTMTIKRLLLALVLSSMLLALPLALSAQDEEAVIEESAGPEGLSTLFFLLGAGAIIIVGGVALARDNFKADNPT
jgi:hypothetical protein